MTVFSTLQNQSKNVAMSSAEGVLAGGQAALRLSLAATKPPALHRKIGWIDFGPAGMVMQNPNSPALRPVGADLPELDRDNPVVVKILTVLEQSVNPAIASHGGRADLVAIEDDVAYLRLSGGCQGCGMAAATLREGIEVAILEAVPEITRVADVTDHANGANPYYTASH